MCVTHSTSRRYDGPAVTLRKVKEPLGEGWVLYSRLAEERIRSVLGGSTAGFERWAFDAIDPVMPKARTRTKRRENRRQKVWIIIAGRGREAKVSFWPVNSMIGGYKILNR